MSLAHEGAGTHDRELISLGLGLSALILVFVNRHRLRQMPGFRWWIAALLVRSVAWTAAVVHRAYGGGDSSLVETALLTVSTGILALGAWVTFVIAPVKEAVR